jgi:hypothetical protein
VPYSHYFAWHKVILLIVLLQLVLVCEIIQPGAVININGTRVSLVLLSGAAARMSMPVVKSNNTYELHGSPRLDKQSQSMKYVYPPGPHRSTD